MNVENRLTWSQFEVELDEKCSICLESLKKGVVIAHDNQGEKHPFHESCIKQWEKVSSTCPVCQYVVDPKSLPNLREVRGIDIDEEITLDKLFQMKTYQIHVALAVNALTLLSVPFASLDNPITRAESIILIGGITSVSLVISNNADLLINELPSGEYPIISKQAIKIKALAFSIFGKLLAGVGLFELSRVLEWEPLTLKLSIVYGSIGMVSSIWSTLFGSD